MKLTKKDLAFIEDVRDTLWERYILNSNEKEGAACFTGDIPHTDELYPQLNLTREEIKKETGRVKLRDVALETVCKGFNDHNFFECSINEADKSLNVEIIPQKEKDTTIFGSLKKLKLQNQRLKEQQLQEQQEDDY